MHALDLCREERHKKFDQRELIVARMTAIVAPVERDNRPLTADEEKQFRSVKSELGRIDVELNELDERIAELEQIDERTAERASRPSLNVNRGGNPWERTRSERLSDADYRSAAIDMVERSADRLGDAPAEQLTASIESGPDATNVAKVVAAGSDPAYRTAWLKVARDERGHLEFTDAEREAWTRAQEVTRAMAVGSSSTGGAMVPTHLDPAVIMTNNGIQDPMRNVATVVQIATGTWNGVSSAGVTASWDAEAEEVSDDSPTLAAPSIDVHAARVFVPFAWEAAQDIETLEAELARLAADAYTRLEGTAFWTGSGTGEPEGVVTKLDATTASEVQLIDVTNYAYALADVYAVHKALPARYRRSGRATWAASIDVLDRTRRFGEGATGSNSAYWADLGADTPPLLLGHRVVEASAMPDYAASNGTNLLILGDFAAGYRVVDRIGTIAATIPMLFGVSNRPTYQAGMAFFRRTGGGTVDTNAFRLLQA